MVETVTVSSKGQGTISKFRRELGINEGERLLIMRDGKEIKFIPLPKLSSLVGVDEELFRGRKPSRERP
ncbi:MAG: AbrB/MazE/SpoVT family DNA-binding domain-containing protein [Candidatus Bathyarchaeia archaeon]